MTKLQTLADEIAGKDTQIKSLQQELRDLKISNKELVAVSKNKEAPRKQVVLLQTDDRLVRKDHQHQKSMQLIEDSKAELQRKVDE